MLIRKMTSEKFNYCRNGASLRVFGWVLLVLGVIYAIMGVTGQLDLSEPGSTGLLIFFILSLICGGLFCIHKGFVYIDRGKRYSRYASIVSSGVTIIDDIAAALPVEFETARRDLQNMVDAGYFQNAYIDMNNHRLVITQNRAVKDETPAYKNTASLPPVTIHCENCGASCTIEAGKVCKCEYCGTILKYPDVKQ